MASRKISELQEKTSLPIVDGSGNPIYYWVPMAVSGENFKVELGKVIEDIKAAGISEEQVRQMIIDSGGASDADLGNHMRLVASSSNLGHVKVNGNGLTITSGLLGVNVADTTNKPTSGTVPTVGFDSNNKLVVTNGVKSADYDAHVINNTHITASERTKWNGYESGKANASALTTHTGNADIHVTKDQKTSWTNHVGTASLHLTTEQTNLIADVKTNKATWNTVSSKVDKTTYDAHVTAFNNHVGSSSLHLSQANINTLNSVANKLDTSVFNTHKNDTTVHITAEERTKWNNGVDSTTLTDHVEDTTIHVTSTDKTNWNKVSQKADTSALTTHTGNADIHVTKDQKTSWTNHVGTASLHLTSDQISLINDVSTNKATWNTVSSKANQSDLTAHTGSTSLHLTSTQIGLINDVSTNKATWNTVTSKVAQTTYNTHVAKVASTSDLGHVKLRSTDFSGLAVKDGVMYVDVADQTTRPEPADSLAVVFNTEGKLAVPFDYDPYAVTDTINLTQGTPVSVVNNKAYGLTTYLQTDEAFKSDEFLKLNYSGQGIYRFYLIINSFTTSMTLKMKESDFIADNTLSSYYTGLEELNDYGKVDSSTWGELSSTSQFLVYNVTNAKILVLECTMLLTATFSKCSMRIAAQFVL